MVPNRSTGSRIEELRKAKNLSQRELALLTRVSHTQIARYEGGAEPTLPIAQRLAHALGVTLDELAGRGQHGAS